MAKPIVIVSCLDTKGREVEYCKQIIEAAGVPTMVIDAGVFAPPLIEPDIPREEVCSAIGACWQAVQQGDKTHRIETIIAGITAIVCELQAKQQIGGLFSIGGGANTIIGTRIMQALPVGIPKLMVSTTSSGRRMFDPYVGTKDIMLMHSVADISGLNAITRTVLKNAAAAMVGMATLGAGQLELPKNTIATTMLGVTTDGVEGAAADLESHGFDVVRFHATGVGGRALEELAKSRVFGGILDLSLHEITCEWFGMGYSYGAPNRLLAAAEAGIPLVCAPGAVDVMDFDLAELPEGWKSRKHIYQHPTVLHLKLKAEEMVAIAKVMAERLNASRGPVKFLAPLRGFHQQSYPGGPLWDPEVDQAFLRELRSRLKPEIEWLDVDANINEPRFGQIAAKELREMLVQHRSCLEE